MEDVEVGKIAALGVVEWNGCAVYGVEFGFCYADVLISRILAGAWIE